MKTFKKSGIFIATFIFLTLSPKAYPSTLKTSCIDALEAAERHLTLATKHSSKGYETWLLAYDESMSENPDRSFICTNLTESAEQYDISAMHFVDCESGYYLAAKTCRGEKNIKLAKRRQQVCRINIKYTKENSYEIYRDSLEYCKP